MGIDNGFVAALVARHGQDMVLHMVMPGDVDTGPDGRKGLSFQRFDVKAVLSSVSQIEIDEGLARQGERRAVLDAAQVDRAPQPGDRVEIRGGSWRVVTVRQVDGPDGTAMLYRLGLLK